MPEAEIEALIVARAEAKKAKNFAGADQIRATLKAAGVELDDKPGGLTQWRRA
jgi:cysteinyl-tRNA synthetase